MAKIPTQIENPNSLHQRYSIKKLVKDTYAMGLIMEADYIKEVPTDPGSEYFVMRLDTGGSDINHIRACRIGINAYADAIEPYIPELANDLRERYPLLTTPSEKGTEGKEPAFRKQVEDILGDQSTTEDYKTDLLRKLLNDK